MNYKQELDFILLLNRLAVYLMPTAMTSLTGNYTMILLYLLKKNFKNPLFYLLIFEGASKICLIKLFVITKMKILKNTLECITRH